jgi:acetyl-CoA C-acetyltransferase
MTTIHPSHIPVLIGTSTLIHRNNTTTKLTQEYLVEHCPSKFLAKTIQLAIRDAGLKDSNHITELIVVNTMLHDRLPFKHNGQIVIPQYSSLARTTAKAAGLKHVTRVVDTQTGGNTPQSVINDFADKVSKGLYVNDEIVVLSGGELLNTFSRATRPRQKQDKILIPPWGELEENTVPSNDQFFIHGNPKLDSFGDATPGNSLVETKNGLTFPRAVYPMLDQAFRISENRDTLTQLRYNAEIFSKFSTVAAALGPEKAWFPIAHSPQEIATPTQNNRWIGFPYTKFMNSVANVDEAGSIVMTSLATANKLGISPSKMIFLHGGGDCHETGYFVSLRPQLHESFAMKTAIKEAMGNKTVDQIQFLDLYSCFPIAVTTACKALGINPLTTNRSLTTCGGLPFCGGPGSAYTILSISSMMSRLRDASYGSFGLITANGWYLTKHAAGLYSNIPPNEGGFHRRNPALVQEELDSIHTPLLRKVASNPNGQGIIETYTVDHSRGRIAFIIGTMKQTGERFVAMTKDDSIMDFMMTYDVIGELVEVETSSSSSSSGKSTFRLVNLDHIVHQGKTTGVLPVNSKQQPKDEGMKVARL